MDSPSVTWPYSTEQLPTLSKMEMHFEPFLISSTTKANKQIKKDILVFMFL